MKNEIFNWNDSYDFGQEDEFAEQFRSLTGVKNVMFGFFDANSGAFSETWVSASSECTADACKNMNILAGRRLAVFAALRDAAPSFVNFVPPEQTRDSYPVWSNVKRHVVAIGRPVEKIYPMMCFPKDENGMADERALVRLGISYVSQRLTQDLYAHNVSPKVLVDATLEMLSIEYFLVTVEGEIRHDGRSELDEETGWVVIRNRLTLHPEDERNALQTAMRQAASDPFKVSIVTVTDDTGIVRLAVVAPVGRKDDGLALVLFENRHTDHNALTQHFFRAYGLTRSESHIAQVVMEGKGLNEVAASTNLSVSTVRSYMKKVFAKTDTHRQSELIALYYKSIVPIRKSMTM